MALAPQESACFTVTVKSSGLHEILRDGEANIRSTLYSGADPVACETSYPRVWCDLAAGTYTLRLTNHAWAGELRVSVVPLMAAAGCPRIASTRYDTAPATGHAANPLGVICHAFDAVPGERITTEFRLATYSQYNRYTHWITDDTGKHICPQRSTDDLDGCVLPQGTGGYRLLAEVRAAGDGFPAPYSLALRRLSNPAGCVPVSMSAYGTAPVQVSPPTGCRSFTPTTTGRYDIRSTTGSGRIAGVAVYTADSRTVCDEGSDCTLTAGVTYLLISNETVQILGRSSTDGCTDDLALASVHRGTISAAGEIDCLHLPVPQGAHVAVQRDESARATVLDARGSALCDDWDLAEGFCSLHGTAPYRLVVDGRYSDETTGDYDLVVRRMDAPNTCRAFLAGDFTANPTRMSVRTGEGVFADCLTIPADGHSAREIVQVQRVTGDSAAEVTVFDPSGERVCAVGSDHTSWAACRLTPGLAHTVLVQGSESSAEFALTRLDVTATAQGCVTTPAAAVGGPSVGGVPAAPGGFRCHQVTTADARDTLHLNVRDSERTARLGVYGADGVLVCGHSTTACAATGSARYQAIVAVENGEAAAPSYRLDALRFATAAGAAPECVKVPSVSYGFGPLSGTLTEQKSAICASLPTATGDRFDLAFTHEGTYDQLPGAWLYDRSYLVNACSRQSGWSAYDCSVQKADSKQARPTTLVIGLPEHSAQASTTVRAQATCTERVCGLEQQTVGTFGPATVGKGKITMTLTGTLLRDTDRVEVYRDGPYDSFRAESTTVSVAPDRRSMTVALDLSYAPFGPLHVTVFTHYGQEYRRGDITVGEAIRSTALPSVTGTIAVGGQVAAKVGSWSLPVDSYAYQWQADGVAIAGATASTYTLPTALFGKRLSVAVTARKAGHPAVTAGSASAAVRGVAPKPTKVPYFTGATRVGSKLTAVVGTWSPAPTSYAYQWRANGVAIAGATASTYVPVASVLGKKLTVTVTAHRTGHLSGAYTTAGYTVATGLAPKATVAPYLTGTVKVGRTLTLNRGTWTPAPTSYAYQWYADGRAISGATKTWFTPTSAQRGTRITVKVTAYRTGHTAGVAWTRSTGAVAG
ncbi:hypothetical protein ACFXGT_03510 [Streptomyces sp. NPDC059352]|uniref:hypothetical protein n=1 Tax=Streptomyces sp. NPDC059352 TaxID=3346810 RepID=UPI0036CD0C26